MKPERVSVAEQLDARMADGKVDMRKLLVVLSAAVMGAWGEMARFDGYRVYRVEATQEEQLIAVRKLAESSEYDFWREPISLWEPIDIMVAPHRRADFLDLVSKMKLKESILVEDVQQLIDAQEKSESGSLDWKSYHSLEDFDAWMNELTEEHSNVKKVVAGVSYEKRNISGVEITFGEGLPTVFMESGTHAREWISSASTSWVVNEILKSPDDSIWRKFNYIYVPFFNPDGYAYTWTTNRLWMKTRTPYVSAHTLCYGADMNKNWDFHWNETGCSKDHCSEAFCGPAPFSEEETKSLSKYLTDNAIKKKIYVYLAFHSYGQLIMHPWTYDPNPSPVVKSWTEIENAAAKDMTAVNNVNFTAGDNHKIFPVSGSSLDWFRGTCNATISFSYQLRDKGEHGFLLPPEEILPSAQELFVSIQTVLNQYSSLSRRD